jgi:hypothetical protein
VLSFVSPPDSKLIAAKLPALICKVLCCHMIVNSPESNTGEQHRAS